MTDHPFYDQLSMEEKAVELGKQALSLKLIPSFTVRYFPDVWQFLIPADSTAEPLTPEEAYMQLQRLIENAAK
jgi:hypothetical protein